MVCMVQCELPLGLHSICIPNTCVSTQNFERERTESEIMTKGKQHVLMCWTPERCFFDTGFCVWIYMVALKFVVEL